MTETKSTVELTEAERSNLYQTEIMRNLRRIHDFAYKGISSPKVHRLSIQADKELDPLYVYKSEPKKLLPTIYRVSTPQGHLGEFHEYDTGTTDNPHVLFRIPGQITPLTGTERLNALQIIFGELHSRSGDVVIRLYSDKFKTPLKDLKLLIKPQKHNIPTNL